VVERSRGRPPRRRVSGGEASTDGGRGSEGRAVSAIEVFASPCSSGRLAVSAVHLLLGLAASMIRSALLQ
jgi:hypothetical protein